MFGFDSSEPGKRWLASLDGHVTIYACVHGQKHRMLHELVVRIEAQTEVWPAVYRTPGGPFALFPLDTDPEIREMVTPEYLALHELRVAASMVSLETAIPETTGILLMAHQPGCLEHKLRLGKGSHIDPDVEASVIDRILPTVGPLVASKAATLRREIRVWTMPVSLDGATVTEDPFERLVEYPPLFIA